MIESNEQVLQSVLDTIRGISDKEYQQRVWIRGEGPEVDDFDESCCNLFGDGDPVVENYKDFNLTEVQYQILKNFLKDMKNFSKNNDFPEEFIDSPEWNEIIEMAKDVLQAFSYQERK